jgi:DNA-directed RNA polymerase specialized sigma24 family protein
MRMSGQVRIRMERIPDPALNPDQALLLNEDRRLALRRFGAATCPAAGKRNALILWLALMEGWRSRDLGRAFALTPRTVDTLIHRLRRRLVAEGLKLRRRRGV